MEEPNYSSMLEKLRKKPELQDAFREQLAERAGVEKDSVNDRSLGQVQSALRGAKVAVESGADPTKASVEQLKAADPAGAGKPSESEEEASNQQKLMMAIAAAVPTMLGAAFGGARGGAIGAEAGANAVTGIGKAIEEEKETKAKRAKEAAELALKRDEHAEKKRGHDIDEKKLDQDKEIAYAKINAEKDLKRLDQRLAQLKDAKAQANELRKEYLGNPLTKQTQEITSAYARLQEVAAEPSAAGDLSMIFSYMKILDPGSTVREGEFANAQNAGGIDAKIVGLYNRIRDGQRLTPEQRADFTRQAENIHMGQLKKQEAFDSSYRDLAGRYGVDAQNVLMGFGQGSTGAVMAARDGDGAGSEGGGSGGASGVAKKLLGSKEAHAAPAPAPKLPTPKVGHKEDGYRFKGGDPRDPKSWERVK